MPLLVYKPVHTGTLGVGKVIIHYPGMLKTINRLLIQATDFLGRRGVTFFDFCNCGTSNCVYQHMCQLNH